MVTTKPISAPLLAAGLAQETQVNLLAYFRRIAYTGNTSPTLQVLQDLHLQHALHIPFDNLCSFLKKPVPLDLGSLQRKLVAERRGGYCFEQNLLFLHVLKTLGYTVRGLAARVLWNVPAHVTTARGHMALLVEIDGEDYLADVGFGGITLTSPLKLRTTQSQATSHEPFRVVPEGEDTFVLQVNLQGAWQPLYRFDLTEQLQPDYEVFNWYISTDPNSPFVMNLMLARTTPEARYTLRNNQMSVHFKNGVTDKFTLHSPAEIMDAMEKIFLVPTPHFPNLETALYLVARPLN